MRYIQTLFASLLLMGVLVGAGTAGVSAQAQPDLTEVEDSGFVSPEACASEPATIVRIIEIIGSGTATPLASGEDLPFLTSEEVVTGEDAEAVRTLQRTMMGCINANDPLRFLSLFSDSFYRMYSGAIEGILDEAEAQTTSDADMQPLDDGYVLISESDVFRLDDGRLIYTIAAAWDTPEADAASIEPDDLIQIVAVEIDGEWLIDELRIHQYDGQNDCGDTCGNEPVATPVTGDGYSGWIMPTAVTEANVVLLMYRPDERITAFLPTETDIAKAESMLPAFVESNDYATDNLISDLAGYERQYFGLESESGRYLTINGFCDALGMDPSTTIVMVEDGGDCFWYAVFDLESGAFESLLVNGEA